MKKSKIKGILKSLFLSNIDDKNANRLLISGDENMDETFYLLKSPANAERLLKSIEDYEKGLGQERNLLNI